MENKLTKLLQIETALTQLETRIPHGLRKESGISQAIYHIEQMIEDEMERETLKGTTNIIPSYADGKYEEIEREYAEMQKALKGED